MKMFHEQDKLAILRREMESLRSISRCRWSCGKHPVYGSLIELHDEFIITEDMIDDNRIFTTGYSRLGVCL
jgi:hypothetical protein